ncbi:MAG: DUF4136 domain-containing protein [Bacteriovoracaceae bacterium]
MKIPTAFMALFLFYACAGVNVKQDYDEDYPFSELASYAWVQTEPKNNERARDSLIKKRIHQYANQFLAKKGFKQVGPAQADFLVDYAYRSKDVILPSTLGAGVGFGVGTRRQFGGLGLGFGGTGQREIETLVIDIVDAKDHSLIWTGRAQENLRSSNPEKTDQNFNRVVRGILEKFPPREGNKD